MSRIDDELEQAIRDAENSSPSAGSRSDGESADAGSEQTGAAFSAHGAGGEAARDVAQPVVSDAESPKRGWGLLAGLCALMAGVLLLVFNSGEDAVVYSYQVNELKAQAAELGDRQVRVQGTLVYGSLVKRDNPCEYRFMIEQMGAKGTEPLKVQYPQCVVADTFREVKGVDVEVTAEGRLAPDGHLDATKIFAKCPSKYEMRETEAQTGQRPEHVGGPAQPGPLGARAEAIR